MNRLPRGCVNVGGDLAFAMEECRRGFLSLFGLWGYHPFLPSALQLLESSWGKLPTSFRSRLVAVNTPFGEPCCLRGDITLAAVAYLASHFSPEERPLRICYCDRIYMKPTPPRTSVESFQIGAELLGWEGGGADVEILSLLLRVLDDMGLNQTVLVLGDATFLQRALAAVESSISDGLAEALRKGSLPDYFSLLEQGNVPDFYKNILLHIPDLRGDPSVLNEAEKLWGVEGPLSALKSLVETLRSLGYEKRISIDLSLVRDPGYYSGPVFDIYSEQLGRSLGGGGRYDRLLSSCGLKGQAIGFALDLEEVAAFSRFRKQPPSMMAWAGSLSPEEALQKAAAFVAKGMNIEMSWCVEKGSSLEGAEKRGCATWVDLSTGNSFVLNHAATNPLFPKGERESC